MKFVTRVFDAARQCRNVFMPPNIFNTLLCRLPEATMQQTLQQMRHLPIADRSRIIILRKIAHSE